MTPDSYRVAERNMGLSPPLLHQWFLYPYGEARTTGGVESLPELSPLLPAPCSPASFSTDRQTPTPRTFKPVAY